MMGVMIVMAIAMSAMIVMEAMIHILEDGVHPGIGGGMDDVGKGGEVGKHAPDFVVQIVWVIIFKIYFRLIIYPPLSKYVT